MMKRDIALLVFLMIGLTVSAQADRQHIRSGNKLFHQQNYAKAEAEYRKALECNAENPQAIYNLGCALLMQQRDSAAVVQFQKAGEHETNRQRRAKSYHNLGVICQTRRMYSEAIIAYKESLRNNPSDDETRYNLALCQRLLKNNPQNNKSNPQKNKKNEKNKDKQNQNKNSQQQPKNDQQDKERMSKDNAEQLLNAAMQEEKATQQRVKNAMNHARPRNLNKNW